MKKQTITISKSVRFGLLVAGAAGIATATFCWTQVSNEHRASLEDLSTRAGLLAHRLSPAVALALDKTDEQINADIGPRLEGHSRLLGFIVVRDTGKMVASAPAVADLEPLVTKPVADAIRTDVEASALVRGPGGSYHVLAFPVHRADGNLNGAVVVVHDALYLEDRLTRGMVRGVIWTASVTLGLFIWASGLAWALFERPLHLLATWMRRLRFGNLPESPPQNLPVMRLADESEHLAASFRAAKVREWDSAQDLVRSERAWTRDRLRAHALDSLNGQQLVVVSNREPYMHQMVNGKPQVINPASGLVTALDPVLRACGGLWVAHGAGDADKLMSNASGCVSVPPDDPRYVLRRVWISKGEEQGYYYGFSNEGLWPLCHLTHERPLFRASDWEQYVRANQRFADATLEEIGPEVAVVMVQDYQLALVPGMLKAARPDLRVGIFWHIPWPNPEAFRICPYRAEILQGMLGADLIGFHLQQHCNNFLDTVDRMVEAKLDWDRFSAEVKGHSTIVHPFPISVQSWQEKTVATGASLEGQILAFKKSLGIEPDTVVGVGVDRIDYTKGIAERFRAIDRFFEKYPQHRTKFTFVQLGAPSRTHIPRYRDLVTELEQVADQINWKFQTDTWKPIHFEVDHHNSNKVYAFMRMSGICIVSSLHDGMNLVAKEYVSAQSRPGEDDTESRLDGVLILSEFAGAARDLPEALIVNPYDTEEFADAIRMGLEMDPKERRERMTRMRIRVEENNVYKWAAEFLAYLAKTKEATPKTGAGPGEPAVRTN